MVENPCLKIRLELQSSNVVALQFRQKVFSHNDADEQIYAAVNIFCETFVNRTCIVWIYQETLQTSDRRLVRDSRKQPLLLSSAGRFSSTHTFLLFNDCFVHLQVCVYISGLTTCLENLEMSGNLTAVREMSGNLLKIRELSGKKSCQGKIA